MTDAATDDNFDLTSEHEFRWPKPGDRLFTVSARWQENAYLDRQGNGRLTSMTLGYKNGADLMVERANLSRCDRDSLVYPIIFNYRHFIELSLKDLIASYGTSAGVTPNWNTHDLEVLWKAFVKVRQYYCPTETVADYAVEQIVAEFANADVASFSYRYPVDKRGKTIQLSHVEIDMANLKDVMDGVDGYFSGCDGFFDDLQRSCP